MNLYHWLALWIGTMAGFLLALYVLDKWERKQIEKNNVLRRLKTL